MSISEEIIAQAKSKLKEYGINKVCLDSLPKHLSDNLSMEKFNRIVDEIVMDTLYWEGKF